MRYTEGMRTSPLLVLVLLAAVAAGTARADTFYIVVLDGQQNSPPLPQVTATGNATLVLNEAGTELSFKTAMIPITGTSLAGKELLAGAFDWSILTVIFASSCVYALIALTITVRQFRREEVLFRA